MLQAGIIYINAVPDIQAVLPIGDQVKTKKRYFHGISTPQVFEGLKYICGIYYQISASNDFGGSQVHPSHYDKLTKAITPSKHQFLQMLFLLKLVIRKYTYLCLFGWRATWKTLLKKYRF